MKLFFVFEGKTFFFRAAIKTWKQQNSRCFKTTTTDKHIGTRGQHKNAQKTFLRASRLSHTVVTFVRAACALGSGILARKNVQETRKNIFAAYGFGSRRNTEKFPSCHVYDPDRSVRKQKENNFSGLAVYRREKSKRSCLSFNAQSSKDDRLRKERTKIEKLFIATGAKGSTDLVRDWVELVSRWYEVRLLKCLSER